MSTPCITVPVGKVLGLERRGWELAAPMDAGIRGWVSRQAAADRHVVIDLDPGIAAGGVDWFPEQTLRNVRLAVLPGDYGPRGGSGPTFGELDPVTASEVLLDLGELAGKAG